MSKLFGGGTDPFGSSAQGSGGGFLINPNHIFVNNAARDAYFSLAGKTDELLKGKTLISVGSGFELWTGDDKPRAYANTNWASKNAVVQGRPGQKGDTGQRGAAGADGSTWFDGSGAPSGSTGNTDDQYLDVDTGDVYKKASDGSWNKTGNIKGGGFNFKGYYSSATAYKKDDVVRWVDPQTNNIGLWQAKGATTNNAPSSATHWTVLFEAAQGHAKPHPQFKAEAIWTPTLSAGSSATDMEPGTRVTQLNVKWNIIDKSAADEVISRADLSFDRGISGVSNLPNLSTHQYTYTTAITQPADVVDVVATLKLTTNKGNTAEFSFSISWKQRWYYGFFNAAANGLTQANVLTSRITTTGGFRTGSGSRIPGSFRIQRSAMPTSSDDNPYARAFVLIEHANGRSEPDNFHLDQFPYLHRQSPLSVNGRDYHVYASVNLTHANDLTVKPAYS